MIWFFSLELFSVPLLEQLLVDRDLDSGFFLGDSFIGVWHCRASLNKEENSNDLIHVCQLRQLMIWQSWLEFKYYFKAETLKSWKTTLLIFRIAEKTSASKLRNENCEGMRALVAKDFGAPAVFCLDFVMRALVSNDFGAPAVFGLRFVCFLKSDEILRV